MTNLNRFLSQGIFCMSVIAAASQAAHAGVFAVVASPPRFELSGAPGETVRASVEISNADAEAGIYSIQTNDWTLDEGGGPQFQQDLTEGSCRPWVALERLKFTLNPKAGRKLRFEVQIPKDAKPRQCRFAVMVSQDEGSLSNIMAGSLPVPLQGRVAIIVYLNVGDVKPNLSIGEMVVREKGKAKVIQLTAKNDGEAHDRLEGVLKATDAAGKSFELTIVQTPVLPGETRTLEIQTVNDAERGVTAPKEIAFPVTVKGVLESESGKKFTIDQVVKSQ
jgi:predicted RNA-binding protein with TRAM domain